MTLTHLIVLLLVGAVAGLIGERLVSRGMPGGLLGAIVAGLVGAWLMVDVLHLVIAPELSLAGVPVLSAILGAAIVVLLFSLLLSGTAAVRSVLGQKSCVPLLDPPSGSRPLWPLLRSFRILRVCIF